MNPECPKCKKPMIKTYDNVTKKISEHIWKFDCDCNKNKNLRLSKG